MKNLLLLFPALALFLLFSCTEKADSVVNLETTPTANISQVANTNPEMATPAGEAALTTMAFAEETYDFGKMKIGEKYKHKFVLTNTGKEPLEIASVKAACACHGVAWTKTAIAPGETGFVMIKYEPKPRNLGKISKFMTMKTNTDPPHKVLNFKGEIVN